MLILVIFLLRRAGYVGEMGWHVVAQQNNPRTRIRRLGVFDEWLPEILH